jgi:hypothetical protein
MGNDVDRGKFLIRPPEHSGHLVPKREELAKEMVNLASRGICFTLRRVF